MIDRRAAVSRAPGSTARGFTLIELMVTIAIAVILLTLAAPSFVSFNRNSQLTTTANTFLAAATAARAEAMKRQQNAFVRPTNASSGWTTGWTSYVDTDWDGVYTANTDIPIATQSAIPASITAPSAGDTSLSDGTSHYLMFSGAGYLWSESTNAAQNQVAVTFSNGTETRLVIMNGSGRMRVCNPASDTTCTTSNVF